MAIGRRSKQARAISALDTTCLEEQITTFVDNLPLSIAISSLLACSTFAILDPHVQKPRLIAWLAIILIWNLFRLLSTLWIHVRCVYRRVMLWLCVLGSLGTGLLWSLVAALFLDYSTPKGPLVSIILCGMTAGAALQGSSIAAAVAALTVPVLVAMILRLFSNGEVGGVILAFDILLFQTSIVRSTMRSQRAFVASIRLREDAKRLAVQLSLESAAASASAADYYHLANHDPLTGAANRGSFRRTLDAWLAEAAPGDRVAMFLIDLDRFKAINDTLGHAAGDEVLNEVAQRLDAIASPRGFVARLGGDEFVMLKRGPDGAFDARVVADAIVDCSRSPVPFAGESIPIGLSLGVAAWPEDGDEAGVLLKRADLALYAAKGAGRGGWRRFDADLLRAAEFAHDVEHDLIHALRDDELEVWFQPQVAIGSGRLTGLEALIRWNHPRHGWVAPPAIVDAALRTGTSDRLTGFVLSRACAMLGRLRAIGRSEVIVAINISPREIGQYDLAGLVDGACRASATDRTRLEIEITEEQLLDDKGAIAVLAAIASTGTRLAVDDFGAGCASLTYLRNLRLDRIKIDRCFVTGLSDRPGDQILVQAILGIGRALGVEVIAEGVESHEDALMLASLGCHSAQGYYFGRPMNEAALMRYLADAEAEIGDVKPASAPAPPRAGALAR